MNEIEQKEKEPLGGERLARFLAHAGVASRRHAEEMIAAGRVKVNGVTVLTQGVRIDPEHDSVSVDGKQVQGAVEHVYLLLHKPVGYVTTSQDPQGRPTVLDLLPEELRAMRVYPVGRLDMDTSGLLLMTNDGDFALHLAHPRYAMDKHYEALVEGYPSRSALEALRNGVTIRDEDGKAHRTSSANARILRRAGDLTWVALTIHEGRKRQVRRMLSAVGHPVRQLIRVGVGPLTLTGVPRGTWRYLTTTEVGRLKEGRIE